MKNEHRITGWLRSNRSDIQTGGALVATVLLLAYTFWHSGNLLARYIEPAWIGYMAALGIEVAIVSLSLRIGELGWNSPEATSFKWTLILVLVVSALANIAEGHYAMYHKVLTVHALQPLWSNTSAISIAPSTTAPAIDWIQAVIGIAATGLLSVIVYALADIIGADVRGANNTDSAPAQSDSDATAEALRVITARLDELGGIALRMDILAQGIAASGDNVAVLRDDITALAGRITDLEIGRATPAIPIAPPTAKARVFELLDNAQGDMGNQVIAEQLGVSLSSVRAYRAQWLKERTVEAAPVAPVPNGNGHHISTGD